MAKKATADEDADLKKWQHGLVAQAEGKASVADAGTLGFFDGRILQALRAWIGAGLSVKDFWSLLPVIIDLITTYGPMFMKAIQDIIDRIRNGSSSIASLRAELGTEPA